MITEGDKKFLRTTMRKLGISALALDASSSLTKHPDLWCYPNEKPPKIVVTREWARQNAEERRKRLVHELLHICRMQHGRKGKYLFSTFPEKDTFSLMVYKGIMKWH